MPATRGGDVLEQLIHCELDPDGVLVAALDMPGRTMNVFSPELMDALDALMDRVDNDDAVKSVVLTSGKPTFLAGADLVMVRGFTDSAKSATQDEMFELCGRLGRQFVRLEASAKPWVAAVNGIALGGGLELALACRVRLVADDPRIQLGVPEVRWGLLPGAGGTQRLPRLAGFEPAMGLLLSGRSVAPADAVRLGIFARAVPAGHLLDEAKAVARASHGKPYDPTAKFPQLAQADVPAYSPDTARKVSLQHGIRSEDVDLYPACGAIVDSVLKGAGLPLAEATAVEMNQFLRLMFNPVAGRMVRTLFLERLRAERELAAPEGVRIESLRLGAISAARRDWGNALAKVRLPQSADTTLAEDTLVLVDQQGRSHRVALRVLDDAPDPTSDGQPLAVLSPAGPYGRVIEIVGAEDGTAAALAALAARLWSLPWRTPGPASVLQRMRGQSLPEQAETALLCAAQIGVGSTAGARSDAAIFLDVAACLAGVTPAWTGGPLTWLWAERKNMTARFTGATRETWEGMEPVLRETYS